MAVAEVVFTGLAAALLSVVPVLLLSRRLVPPARRTADLHLRVEPTVLLFRGEDLVDATQPARAMLQRLGADTRSEFAARLLPRLPDLPAVFDRAAREGRAEAFGTVGRGTARLRLTIEEVGAGLTRLSIADPEARGAGIVVDALAQAALEEEAGLLREAADHAPMLAWRQQPDGELVWANAAYLQLCDTGDAETGLWPLPRLFDLSLPPADAEGEAPTFGPERRELVQDGVSSWYDCHGTLAENGDQLMFALPADAAVRAERSLREFVQTLTKTFAGLPIGLAIFDRERHLQLFNPALIDLTNLPTGFLSARPTLHALLDRLRETRMIPEPRDYRSWRKQMSELEAGAAAGYHVETWSLPGGQTYRMTGRPHADGGIAFLLEDITSEVTLTRRFRAELTAQSQALDALEDAVAVFAADGSRKLANAAWTLMWGPEPFDLAHAAAAWGLDGRNRDGAGLARLLEAVAPGAPRSSDSGACLGPDGAPVGWRLTPLPGGQTMITFRRNPAVAQPGLRAAPRRRDAAAS